MSVQQWGGTAICVLIVLACIHLVHRLAQASPAISDEDREAWPGAAPARPAAAREPVSIPSQSPAA